MWIFIQIEVLQAEVSALKELVITSTPSMPNTHLHPQIAPKNGKKVQSSKSGLFDSVSVLGTVVKVKNIIALDSNKKSTSVIP